MTRERALKVVLVLVGLLFSAAAYPLLAMHLQEALLIDGGSNELISRRLLNREAFSRDHRLVDGRAA